MNRQTIKSFLVYLPVLSVGMAFLFGCKPKSAEQPAIIFTNNECRYEGPDQIKVGDVSLKIQSDDKAYPKYGVAVMTLYEGKTLADLQAWKSTDKPVWAEIVAFKELNEGDANSFIIQVKRGPIYFNCFVSPPDTNIGAFGPIQVEE